MDYALKLTLRPRQMAAGDVSALREQGLSDAAIHDAAAVTSYFNFVNRIALGLGVELEAGRGAPPDDAGRSGAPHDEGGG